MHHIITSLFPLACFLNTQVSGYTEMALKYFAFFFVKERHQERRRNAWKLSVEAAVMAE